MTQFTVSVNSLLAEEAEFNSVQSKMEEINMRTQYIAFKSIVLVLLPSLLHSDITLESVEIK